MQKLQDEFHNKVGIKTGLTRIGPVVAVWLVMPGKQSKSKRRLLPMRKLLQLLAIVLVSKAKAEATEIVAQAQRESEGVRGQDVRLVLWSSRWLARAKRESQGRGYQGQGWGSKAQEEAQKALEDAEKVKAKAKKEADQRVANVANQLTEERTKTKDLAEELRKAQEQANDLAKRLALYEDPTKGTDHNGGASSRSEGVDFLVKFGITRLYTQRRRKMARELEVMAVKLPPEVKKNLIKKRRKSTWLWVKSLVIDWRMVEERT